MTKKAERLANRTNAEIRFCEMLDDRGIDYEAEAIIQNGDSFVLIDALVKKPKVVAFELDGSVHDRQKRYDMQRDRWLLRSRKIPTVRFRNQDVYKRIAWSAKEFSSLSARGSVMFSKVRAWIRSRREARRRWIEDQLAGLWGPE
jgi:very-short-patch-repair endonuclease